MLALAKKKKGKKISGETKKIAVHKMTIRTKNKKEVVQISLLLLRINKTI
jgi:hypothetical protein